MHIVQKEEQRFIGIVDSWAPTQLRIPFSIVFINRFFMEGFRVAINVEVPNYTFPHFHVLLPLTRIVSRIISIESDFNRGFAEIIKKSIFSIAV